MEPRRSAWSRAWLTLSAAALAACQGLPGLPWSDPSPAPPGPSWRVVERLGEARYLAPSMAGWEEVAAGSMIPAGSQITTGIGGRLIIHHAANQLSAGTGSRFILPGWEEGESVRQTAGWLRYRIMTSSQATFDIETPFLDLAVDDAVLDVTVGESETEVAVVSGRVRVKSLDGRRQIDLHAGYTGYASLEGDPLAVRRGPDRPREAVPAIVIPALHPDRARTGVAADPAATAMPAPRPAIALSPPAEAAVAVPVPAAPVPAAAATTAFATAPATAPADERAVSRSDEASLARADAEPIVEIRRRFDVLTEGLLDGLLPALPPARRADGR